MPLVPLSRRPRRPRRRPEAAAAADDHGRGTGRARPLVLTADDDLVDALVRLAAVAGVEVEVARDPGAAAVAWAAAPLVLVGDDVAVPASRCLPRRRSITVVATDPDDAGVWRRAVDLGAERVAVLPEAETVLVEVLGDDERRGLVLGVVGGCGGAGASVLAAGLAATAAREGADAVLLDLDPLGGGLDLLVGGERDGGARWSDVAVPLPGAAQPDVDRLPSLLPRAGGAAVLSWSRDLAAAPPPVEAVAAVVAGASRGGTTVVVDLPRVLDERARAVLQRCDAVVLVVPCTVRAVAAAGLVLGPLAAVCPDVRPVVRLPAPGGLSPDVVADVLGLPLAGVLAPEPHLAEALERGDAPATDGRGPLAGLCRELLAQASRSAVPA